MRTSWMLYLLLAVLAGCRSGPRHGGEEEAVEVEAAHAERVPRIGHDQGEAPFESKPFTLEEVRARILGLATPRLSAESFRPAEARGRVDQAGLWPNPYLKFLKRGGEDFDVYGTGLTALEIGQPIELGGKRSSRTRRAKAEAAVAVQAFHAVTLEALLDAEVQFTRVLRLQQDLAEAKQEAKTAGDLEALSSARFASGKDSRIALLRFQAAAENARLAVQDLERRHSRSCQVLDGLLGVKAGTTTGVEGSWSSAVLSEPERQDVRKNLLHHPQLLAAGQSVTAADRAVESSTADAWPDVTLGLVYRRDQDEKEDVFGLMVKLPLPVLNRNQGVRAESRARARRARKNLEAETLKLNAELEAALISYSKAVRNVAGYEEDILPKLEQSLALTRSAYRAGRASYLDVLDSLLALIRTRRERLDHLEERGRAAAKIRYLAGWSVNQRQSR